MQNEFELPPETIPGQLISRPAEELIELQNCLENRGVPTKNTRIERYIEYLKQLTINPSVDPATIFKNSAEGPCRHQIDWVLYVLRETHELMWILKGLKACVPLGIDDKLKVIVGGRDFAALDQDSRSRDTQFELRIASYFCQAGCDVNLSTETDIIAVSDDEAFYLECKRVGSRNQLSRRLSDVKDQLRRRIPKKRGKRTIFGCIAVDITKIAFSHNGVTAAATNEVSRDRIQEKLSSITNTLPTPLLFDDCPNLFNYWFQIHIPSLILYPQMPTTRFSSLHIFKNEMRRKERRAQKAFCNLFELASQNDPKEKPCTEHA